MTLISQLGCQDDAASTVVDDAVAADGTLNGGENTDAKSVAGLAGLFPKAFDLNGTDDYIFGASLDTSGLLTVCAWVDADTLSNFRGIFSSKDPPTSLNNSQLYLVGDLMRWRQSDADTEDATASTALTSGWHHVAAVRSGSTGNWTITFYIDAVAAGSGAIANNPPAGAFGVCWGRSTFSAAYWDGRMLDLRIYNEALDAAALATIMEDAEEGGGAIVDHTGILLRQVMGGEF